MTLVQCVQDMHAGGEIVDLVKLREWMAERGIHLPRGGKHPSMMRLWLEKAGVFAATERRAAGTERGASRRSAAIPPTDRHIERWAG